MIGAPGTAGGDGQAVVFFGAAPGSLVAYGAVSSAERAGAAVAGIGDFDGDGFDDIAVGAPAASGGTGRVYMHLGNAAMSIPMPIAVDSVEPTAGFGRMIASR